MPKLALQLTELVANKAKPKKRAYTLASGQGLLLLVLPSGLKQWQVRYREQDGRRGKRIVGVYPEMGIAAAHQAAAELHQRVRMGQPAEGLYDRLKVEREALTQEEIQQRLEAEEARKYSFAVVSDAWLESRKSDWAPATYTKSVFIVQKRLQPMLGDLDMRTMASKDVVGVLVDLATATPSIAIKARQCLNGVVDYCIVRGIRGDDQVLRLQRALPRHRGSHIPAVTKIQGVGPLMRGIQAYEGRVVRGGLLLAAYTACRPGVVASARWAEMDLDHAEWCIPADKMKTRIEHIVSLPKQAPTASVGA